MRGGAGGAALLESSAARNTLLHVWCFTAAAVVRRLDLLTFGLCRKKVQVTAAAVRRSCRDTKLVTFCTEGSGSAGWSVLFVCDKYSDSLRLSQRQTGRPFTCAQDTLNKVRQVSQRRAIALERRLGPSLSAGGGGEAAESPAVWETKLCFVVVVLFVVVCRTAVQGRRGDVPLVF